MYKISPPQHLIFQPVITNTNCRLVWSLCAASASSECRLLDFSPEMVLRKGREGEDWVSDSYLLSCLLLAVFCKTSIFELERLILLTRHVGGKNDSLTCDTCFPSLLCSINRCSYNQADILSQDEV